MFLVWVFAFLFSVVKVGFTVLSYDSKGRHRCLVTGRVLSMFLYFTSFASCAFEDCGFFLMFLFLFLRKQKGWVAFQALCVSGISFDFLIQLLIERCVSIALDCTKGISTLVATRHVPAK